MSAGRGLNSFIGFITESVFGTDPGSGYKYVRVASMDPCKPTADRTEGNRGLGRIARTNVKKRLKRGTFGGEIDCQYGGLEVLLLHFLGGYTFDDNNPVASANTHVFVPSLTRQVGLTIHSNLDILALNVTGGKMNRLSFECSNEILRMGYGGVGKAPVQASVDTASYSATPDVLGLEGTGGATGAIFKLAGTAANIRKVTFNLEWPVTEDREYMGYNTMQEAIQNGDLKITGTITREFEDDDYLDHWDADTADLTLEVNYKSVSYITGTTPYEFKIKAFAVDLDTAGPARVDGPGVLVEDIPFVANVAANGTDIFSVTIINAVATVT
jgi:hypothetical protein